MNDGGSLPRSELSADAGIPVVVAEEAAGGASLLVVAVFAYLKVSLMRVFRVAAWLLRGREHLERKLVKSGVAPALALSPRLAAYVDAAPHLYTSAPRTLAVSLAAGHAQHLVVLRQGLGASLSGSIPEAFDGGQVPPPGTGGPDGGG